MGKHLDLDDVAATSELATKELAELRAALAKAREALKGVCDSDEECQDSDGWTAAVISFEALHEAQESLAAIDALGQTSEEVMAQKECRKEPEKTCMNCGTSGCDHNDAMRCANGRSLWEPRHD